ncbi:MAG: alpha/beta hydrolase [Mucilaginibacter sp.]|nr:alpha/beta hydrolase [Mucilaginibacter sp.]
MKYLLLALLFVTATNSTFAQKTTATDSIVYGSNPATGKYVDIRGFKMYYETYGSGEPILFIHGNGGSIYDFRNQIPYFAKNYQVIIADSRAQGKSADLKNDSLSYEMMTDDLNALLDNLHLKNVNVVGWSDGGINGLLMAIRHPDKVKKLAVTGANLWPDTTAVNPYLNQVVVQAYLHAVDTLKKIKDVTPEMRNEVKLLRLLGFEPHITIAQLHTITCPALIIGGDQDVIRPEHTLLISQSIPKAFLWILPNSGHSTPIYYKEQFNATVADFFVKSYQKREKFDVLK